MSELMEILDFPPAPKLNVYGELDAATATANERRGELRFNGKAQCVRCHQAPYYTDNTMHDLRAERFYKQSWRTGCGPRRPDQDIPAARDQGLAAVLA